jgi:hypothetical protein
MKLVQIGNCCSWKTEDGRFQIDYWHNANRPRKANGDDGGYGMYSVTELIGPQHPQTSIGNLGGFTSKRAAIAAIAKAQCMMQ